MKQKQTTIKNGCAPQQFVQRLGLNYIPEVAGVFVQK